MLTLSLSHFAILFAVAVTVAGAPAKLIFEIANFTLASKITFNLSDPDQSTFPSQGEYQWRGHSIFLTLTTSYPVVSNGDPHQSKFHAGRFALICMNIWLLLLGIFQLARWPFRPKGLRARVESLQSELAHARKLQAELAQTPLQTIFDAGERRNYPREEVDSGDVEKDQGLMEDEETNGIFWEECEVTGLLHAQKG